MAQVLAMVAPFKIFNAVIELVSILMIYFGLSFNRGQESLSYNAMKQFPRLLSALR